jgi:hypothetical protein
MEGGFELKKLSQKFSLQIRARRITKKLREKTPGPTLKIEGGLRVFVICDNIVGKCDKRD